jgi:hypothetical protein
MMRPCLPWPLARAAATIAGVALVAGSPPAGAVFIQSALAKPNILTLRVGSADTVQNRVKFDVQGVQLYPNPTPVTGVPQSGAPVTSPPGGIEIEVDLQNAGKPDANRTVSLRANSSAGLACAAPTCGTISIPMTTISWTSYNLQASGNGLGKDIQDGRFDGSTGQLLAQFQAVNVFGSARSITMKNVLIFQYDNLTLYPQGHYVGVVTFTASAV